MKNSTIAKISFCSVIFALLLVITGLLLYIRSINHLTVFMKYKDVKYDRYLYNCNDFSTDLRDYLHSKNIESFKVSVSKIVGIGDSHSLVAVLIEPQTGNFVPIGKYKYLQLSIKDSRYVTWDWSKNNTLELY